MMDEYKRANDTLHPTHSAGERAVKGEASRRKRKPLKALVPAGVAAAAAVALLITGLPGPDGGSSGGPLAGSAYAIALPEYPDLPKCPAEPLGGGEAEWERFNQDYDAYWNAWRSYQDETASLRDTPDLTAALTDYTGRSAALALSGGGQSGLFPRVPVVCPGHVGRDHRRGDPAAGAGCPWGLRRGAAAGLGRHSVARPLPG